MAARTGPFKIRYTCSNNLHINEIGIDEAEVAGEATRAATIGAAVLAGRTIAPSCMYYPLHA
jgi:hypothetical protein